jgi:hypothetical protein
MSHCSPLAMPMSHFSKKDKMLHIVLMSHCSKLDKMSHCSKLDKMSHCSRLWALEGPGGSWKEPPEVAPWVLILDPTVWLDGARLANTCIPPSFS